MADDVPWWQRTGGLGLTMFGAVLWPVQATVQWLAVANGHDAGGFRAPFAALTSVLGLWYIASFVARSRRGERLRSRHGHGSWRNL